jgi:transposase
MQPRVASDEPPRPWPWLKPGSQSKNQPRDDVRAPLARITGVDLVAVTGIAASMAQTILCAVGPDMSQVPPVKHCCSWRGLAPHHDVSGGQVLRSRTLQGVSRATQALRQAAQAVARSGSSFGAYFRAMRARLGPPQATVATAQKIARVVYHLLTDREPCNAESAAAYEHQRRERERNHLTRRTSQLGDRLTPVAISQPASPL